ncbi:Ldh family oxidoreductase [uncultured Ruegeria sp.]|uniref:Ldh family oxidoreductase n=1 Tax=uncultured Ruegeria sp. TaxID=259304 RepID=UPI0026287823|nr:Ldh family oxidoreductase [uncultured Ruegeria sp.]
METVELRLDEIEDLARSVFERNGCDADNANALARTVTTAERDGSVSHGLIRIPGYVASLRSGKVNGAAVPKIFNRTPAIISANGDNGYAPLAIERGIPKLAKAAKQLGVAVMALTHSHHFAALWPEVEALADHGLVGLACVNYTPAVGPYGSRQPLFGTNPMAFAWSRLNKPPVVFDMATASMAIGDVKIAARDGHAVPSGTCLDKEGNDTTDPNAILDGVLLPFGGHKGSAIALMVELLAAGAIGERFSYEAAEADNGDGGHPRGGEIFLALSPDLLAGRDWQTHSEKFLRKFEAADGARLPGQRRHRMRISDQMRLVNTALLENTHALK